MFTLQSQRLQALVNQIKGTTLESLIKNLRGVFEDQNTVLTQCNQALEHRGPVEIHTDDPNVPTFTTNNFNTQGGDSFVTNEGDVTFGDENTTNNNNTSVFNNNYETVNNNTQTFNSLTTFNTFVTFNETTNFYAQYNYYINGGSGTTFMYQVVRDGSGGDGNLETPPSGCVWAKRLIAVPNPACCQPVLCTTGAAFKLQGTLAGLPDLCDRGFAAVFSGNGGSGSCANSGCNESDCARVDVIVNFPRGGSCENEGCCVTSQDCCVACGVAKVLTLTVNGCPCVDVTTQLTYTDTTFCLGGAGWESPDVPLGGTGGCAGQSNRWVLTCVDGVWHFTSCGAAFVDPCLTPSLFVPTQTTCSPLNLIFTSGGIGPDTEPTCCQDGGIITATITGASGS